MNTLRLDEQSIFQALVFHAATKIKYNFCNLTICNTMPHLFCIGKFSRRVRLYLLYFHENAKLYIFRTMLIYIEKIQGQEWHCDEDVRTMPWVQHHTRDLWMLAQLWGVNNSFISSCVQGEYSAFESSQIGE